MPARTATLFSAEAFTLVFILPVDTNEFCRMIIHNLNASDITINSDIK